MRRFLVLLFTIVIVITGYEEFVKNDKGLDVQSVSDSQVTAADISEEDDQNDEKTYEDISNENADKKDDVIVLAKEKSTEISHTTKATKAEPSTRSNSSTESSATETPTVTSDSSNTSDEQTTEAPCTEQPASETPCTEAPEPSTTEVSPAPEPEPEPEAVSVSYSPDNVVSLATSKCIAGGMIRTTDNLDNLLANGSITQEEYNDYYPYDGLGYYSVFVETDMNKASTTSGRLLGSEDGIADYIAGMLLLESNPYFLIEYAGTTDSGGQSFYEFRCYR